MFEPHEGEVALQHKFAPMYKWLRSHGEIALTTAAGTHFTTRAEITKRGAHGGEMVIRFFQEGTEYSRAYECCWGHYYNCYRQRIGMYCKALDSSLS
jgi:hypothetical protein